MHKRTIGGSMPRGTYAPYESTHELVFGDLRPIGIQTETYMNMYIFVFMSDVFIL
jgi:hypothetical protein